MSNYPWASIRESLRHQWRKSRSSVSLTIVYVCVGLFVLVAVADVFGVVDRQLALSVFGLSFYGLVKKLWVFQLITAPLLHAGIWHLVFNMFTLWMLGPSVEDKIGRRAYIALSVTSGLSAMIAFVLVNWGTGNIVLGYSGIIFGILVAQAWFYPEHRIILFWFFPVKMKHAVFVLGAISLYLTIAPEQGVVSHVSHLFGAVGAVVYLWLRSKLPGFGPYYRLSREKPVKQSSKTIALLRKKRIEGKIPRKL